MVSVALKLAPIIFVASSRKQLLPLFFFLSGVVKWSKSSEIQLQLGCSLLVQQLITKYSVGFKDASL